MEMRVDELLAGIRPKMKLQDWVDRIDDADRKKLSDAMRFSSTPADFNSVMEYLRGKYDFVPR